MVSSRSCIYLGEDLACSIPHLMKLGAISKSDSEVYRLESCPSTCWSTPEQFK